MTEPWLYSIGHGSSAEAVAALLRVLFPDAVTVLDMTYGSGRFWTPRPAVDVYGIDLDPTRARGGRVRVGDFRSLPFPPETWDVTIFDPPFQANPGKGRPGIMSSRFAAYDTVEELQSAVERGAREAIRLARFGAVIKVQNQIHGSTFLPMTRWVEDAIGLPLFDEHHVERPQKLRDRKWTRQLSVWRRHATYLVFRKDGPAHKPRRSVSPRERRTREMIADSAWRAEYELRLPEEVGA